MHLAAPVALTIYIRKHGDHWTTLRNAVDELDRTKLLRVSFDNLNYKIKFAKKLGDSESGGPQRMLNLITGQAVFRYDNPSDQRSITSLKDLSKKSLQSFMCPHTFKTADLDVHHFKLDTGCASDYLMSVFMDAVYKCTLARIKTPISELDTSLMVDIRQYLPHFTPKKGEAVVYTTVDEALAGNTFEVSGYLDKLKADLCIGTEGYPQKIVLTGDQQT